MIMEKEDNPQSANDIDKFVCAELPTTPEEKDWVSQKGDCLCTQEFGFRAGSEKLSFTPHAHVP